MTRNTALKIINPVLLVFFTNQAVSVLFREHYSPQAFKNFHMNSGIILLCLIALHLTLNFNWVKANFFPRH